MHPYLSGIPSGWIYVKCWVNSKYPLYTPPPPPKYSVHLWRGGASPNVYEMYECSVTGRGGGCLFFYVLRPRYILRCVENVMVTAATDNHLFLVDQIIPNFLPICHSILLIVCKSDSRMAIISFFISSLLYFFFFLSFFFTVEQDQGITILNSIPTCM